jgi:hypothetical protein
VPFWQDLGLALREIWDTFRNPESEVEPEPEEFGGDSGEPPEEPPYTPFGEEEDEPDEDDSGQFNYFGGGPYPFDWGEGEERFWNTQMDGFPFQNEVEYENLQDLFYHAYMDRDISTEERREYREQFLEDSYIVTINWAAFREYHGY